MNEPEIPTDPRAVLDLGRLLGQRRPFGAVAGRCSAAHAQLLRRIRDEKLYRPLTPSWRAFCSVYLALSRRHADRLIGLLNRFGPVYFEFSQLAGVSPSNPPSVKTASSSMSKPSASSPRTHPRSSKPSTNSSANLANSTTLLIPRPSAPASKVSPAADTPSSSSSSPSTMTAAPSATANSSSKSPPSSA